MPLANETRIEYLTTRYQAPVFKLVLHLIGGDKNAAYDISTAAFVRAVQTAPLFEEELFFTRLIAQALHQCRDAVTMPVIDESDLLDFPPEKRKSLQITKKALYALPLDAKAPLLLRDQMHLSYKLIAAVLKVSEKNARIETNNARAMLRKKVEEILKSMLPGSAKG